MTSRKTKTQKARSASARKGWETRRARVVPSKLQAYTGSGGYTKAPPTDERPMRQMFINGVSIWSREDPEVVAKSMERLGLSRSSEASASSPVNPLSDTHPWSITPNPSPSDAEKSWAKTHPEMVSAIRESRMSGDTAFLYDVDARSAIPNGFKPVVPPPKPSLIDRIKGWFR